MHVLVTFNCLQCVRLCLSVCPSVPSFARHTPLAAVSPAGRRYWSIAARPAVSSSGAAARRSAANAGSATLSADVASWTQTCLKSDSVPPGLSAVSTDIIQNDRTLLLVSDVHFSLQYPWFIGACLLMHVNLCCVYVSALVSLVLRWWFAVKQVVLC